MPEAIIEDKDLLILLDKKKIDTGEIVRKKLYKNGKIGIYWK